MKKTRVGKRVEVTTPRGVRTGKVISEFIGTGGPEHNRKFVVVILDDADLTLFDREVVYHISEIKILD